MTYRSLSDFIARHPRLFVLTGAGCSTESGIPDYRDTAGGWKRSRPVMLQAFLGDAAVRRRYWARSFVGWPRFNAAAPNGAHRALSRLEQQGRLALLVTQNVDRLHQAAGSRRVLDLHGRLDLVRCLECGSTLARGALQEELLRRNPEWAGLDARRAPDGDADLKSADFAAFNVSSCRACGGILKPEVVFFGENVPRERVGRAMIELHGADALLAVGTSLMVYSGYRFARAMAEAGKPIAAVTLGRTRADDMLALKVRERCSSALAFLLESPSQMTARFAAPPPLSLRP